MDDLNNRLTANARPGPRVVRIFRLGWNRVRDVLSYRPILARVIALLALLLGIKCWLLVSLAPHLYHTHWRLGGHALTRLDYASFGCFGMLVLIAFIILGRQMAGSPPRVVRTANLLLGVAALLFVILNFKRVNSNYIYPVMTGVLAWADIGHYLIQDLFFEPPYLAVYLLVYAFAYWIFARTGREHWSVYGLGILAVTYLGLNLIPLAELSLEVLVINCFGIAGLASYALTHRPLSWRWLLLPIALASLGWLLFAKVDPTLRQLDPYSINLVTLGLTLAALGYVLSRRLTLYPAVSHCIPFFFLAFVMLPNRNYPSSANYNHLVAYGLALPHYFLQELLLVGFMGVALAWLYWHRSRLAKRAFDGLAIGLVVVALVDLQVTQRMGFRLDWHALVMNPDPVLLWRTIKPFLGALGLGVGVVVGLYFGLVAALRQWNGQDFLAAAATRPRWGVFAASAILLLALLTPLLSAPDKAQGLGLTRVLATSPLFTSSQATKYTATEFDQTARSLGFDNLAQQSTPAPATTKPADLNVFLVIMESWYNRYLSLFGAADETQPLLKKYRDRMELFPNFYANWPASINARFTVLSGIYAPNTYATFVNPRLEVPTLFDLLYEHDYVVSLYDSCHRYYQRWDDFLRPRKINFFYDADTMPGKDKYPAVSWGVSETATMEAIKSQFARHAQRHERFFLTYMPVAPHMPFDSPCQGFEKFDNGCGMIDGNFTGRYKNQLLYIDWILTSLLDELDRQGLLDQTLVVITDDHGEMVGEDDGKVGHGWNLAPRLSNIPLIILDPRRRGYRLNNVLGSQVDVLPTVLDLLHIPPPTGELYEGVSLYDAAANQNKTVYLNSHYHRALIRGTNYFLDTREIKPTRKHSSPIEVYAISHQGPKTNFQLLETAPPDDVLEQLNRFDEFQMSLLIHYTAFRKYHQDTPDNAVHARTRQSRRNSARNPGNRRPAK